MQSQSAAGNQAEATVKAPPRCRMLRRLRIITYNVGGFTSGMYEVFKDWLENRCQADVVVGQETHWGLRRDENRWLMPEGIVISSPDRDARHSGVAFFVRRVCFLERQVSHVVWIPGRLLHVRCSSQRITLDLIAGYQHVWQERSNESTVRLRHQFWLKIGLLPQGLPARHLLILAADLNTHCRPVPGHVGRGVMRAIRKPELEFEELPKERDLVLLNSWGRATPGRCSTFENGSAAAQLDFICTRRPQADAIARQSGPIALDVAPWRRGPKHKQVLASLPWVPGWFCRHDVSAVYAVVNRIAPRKRIETKCAFVLSKDICFQLPRSFEKSSATFRKRLVVLMPTACLSRGRPWSSRRQRFMLQSAACTGGKQSRVTVYLLLDPDPMATFYTRILNECNAKQNWFPEEATDCLLSLLPINQVRVVVGRAICDRWVFRTPAVKCLLMC